MDASGNTISSFVLQNSDTIVPLGLTNSQQLVGRFELSSSTPFTTVIFDRTLPNNGGFGIDSLDFFSKEKAGGGVCPEMNVQHWDKIIFEIKDRVLAKKVNLTAGTELDIKVLDDPHKVADIKQKVLDFLKVPTAPKKAIQILDVNYAIICASQIPSGIKSSVENATQAAITPIVNATNVLSSFNTTESIIPIVNATNVLSSFNTSAVVPKGQ